MDRAHRLGQTKQVTVYRMITRGTIEERIRKRALQKEEVQRVVISGGAAGGVDFNTRNRNDRSKDMISWVATDEEVEKFEQKQKEVAEKPDDETARGKKKKAAAIGLRKKRGEMSLDDMYHEGKRFLQLPLEDRANCFVGEGHFDDVSAKPSGAATPVPVDETQVPKKGVGSRGGKGISKKAKTVKERLKIIDAEGDMGMGGM